MVGIFSTLITNTIEYLGIQVSGARLLVDTEALTILTFPLELAEGKNWGGV